MLGTRQVCDLGEKYPAEENLNRRSPGKRQGMDTGAQGARHGQGCGAGRATAQRGWDPALGMERGWRKTVVRKADPCAPVIPCGPADQGTCTCAPSTSAQETGGAISVSQRSLPGATSACCCLLPSVIFTVSKCPCRAPAHEIRTPWPLPF